jgi:hypothetical protein
LAADNQPVLQVSAAATLQVEQLSREQRDMPQRLQGASPEELLADSKLLQQAQQQLAESDSLVQQQARVIGQLEQQLLGSGGSGGNGSFGSGGGGSQGMLEAENASLRQVLQQMQAQLSVLQKLQHAEPREQPSRSEQELQGQVERLQGALRLREEQHERQLRALRQEHERLRVEQGIR